MKVLSQDDAGDPTRSRSIIKNLVENHHVMAFLGNTVPLTAHAGRSYLESKRIPVIGGSMTEMDWNESPVFFPQGTAINKLSAGLGRYGVAQGYQKLGQLVCVETPACTNSATHHGRGAEQAGGEVVYAARISIVQPDYTAECLQARNRGAQTIVVWADANSLSRIAASCARQGYRPTFGAMSLTVTTRLQDDPNLEGSYAVVPTFPWVQADTPATLQYQAAMRQYAPTLELAAITSNIWTAGKLLERAASHIDGPITTASLFEGLWAIKDDDLGGLAPPLRFERDRGAPEASCFFLVNILHGRWTAPPANRDCLS